jgi:hypothetical protein
MLCFYLRAKVANKNGIVIRMKRLISVGLGGGAYYPEESLPEVVDPAIAQLQRHLGIAEATVNGLAEVQGLVVGIAKDAILPDAATQSGAAEQVAVEEQQPAADGLAMTIDKRQLAAGGRATSVAAVKSQGWRP